jgi:hypothetical protein
MATFTFVGSIPMTYPDIVVDGQVLVAQPGETYELDAAPDERFEAVGKATDKLAKPDLTKAVETEIEPSETSGDASVS